MTQRTRIVVAVLILVLAAAAILSIDALRRRGAATSVVAGSIPIYLDGRLSAAFVPGDLERLPKASFVEPAEGVLQDGWLLRDVILLYVPRARLAPQTRVMVSSSSRDKSAELTWGEVDEESNKVMFDLSNRGTLKLVSLLEKLDSRDEWVQDTDRIEILSQ